VNQHFVAQPLLAAEIAYVRYPRDEWELLLARMRQLGANTLAVEVPWAWHAVSPDMLDLDGRSNPQRDLLGFVWLCGELGLRVLLKLQLSASDVPGWLLRAHPEIQLPHVDEQLRPARACVLHPAYLAAAQGWLAALSAALLPQQSPQGPIAALQASAAPPVERLGLGNAYLRSELWPRWLREAGRARFDRLAGAPAHELPEALDAAQGDDILEAFASWVEATAVGTLLAWLREEGWKVPICVSMPERIAAELPSFASASGWLSYTSADRSMPTTSEPQSFAAYVHQAHWRPRLARQFSPGLPAFALADPADDFAFAAPLLGGLQGLSVAADAPGPLGMPGRRAPGTMLRQDGSVRPRFWRARLPLLLLGAAEADFAAARAPAGVALGYRQAPSRRSGEDLARVRALARRLVRASVAFDLVDLDIATAEVLTEYALVVAPAGLPHDTLAKLDGAANLVLVGDAHVAGWELGVGGQEDDANHQHLLLPEEITGERLGELAEDRGGTARYAWADSEAVDVSVRYGGEYTFLFVANRQPAPYNGTITYRAPDTSIQHVHLGIGGRRVGIVLIKDDEVLGMASGGDGAEGGWLARGLHTSIVFNNGAGTAAPCGGGLLFSAAQSGRFQVRRPQGWHGLAAWRLLLNGTLLQAGFQSDGVHVGLAYVAEDERGQTDVYLLLPAGQPLPHQVHIHTATLLRARSLALQRAAELADRAASSAGVVAEALALAAQEFARAAAELAALVGRPYTIEEYGVAWEAAGVLCRPPIAALAHAREYAIRDAADVALEDVLTHILGIAARWNV
jgi:hypothetical protein